MTGPSRRHVWRGIVKAILGLGALLLLTAAVVLGTFWWQAHARETRTRLEAAPSRGRFVQAADVEIFVQELGPSGAPVVLFVHGMGAWSELWRETLAATAAAGFRAVALDLPPFGYSQRPANAWSSKRRTSTSPVWAGSRARIRWNCHPAACWCPCIRTGTRSASWR